MAKICELKIQCFEERKNMVIALTNAGYKASIDVKKSPDSHLASDRNYYVVWESKGGDGDA